MLTTMTKKVDGNITITLLRLIQKEQKQNIKIFKNGKYLEKEYSFTIAVKQKMVIIILARNLITGKKEIFFSDDIVTVV